MEDKTINIPIKRLYQLLITECRYGYARNNHLMPSCAYFDVKEALTQMLDVDESWALSTAEQLCEECISDQLNLNFGNGLDDEFGNRTEAVEFIEYLLKFVKKYKSQWQPYNYRLYEDNLKKEASLHYSLIKLPCFDQIDFNGIHVAGETLEKNLSKCDAYDSLYEILGSSDFLYYKRKIYNQNTVVGEVLKISSPKSHADEIYAIVLDKDALR